MNATPKPHPYQFSVSSLALYVLGAVTGASCALFCVPLVATATIMILDYVLVLRQDLWLGILAFYGAGLGLAALAGGAACALRMPKGLPSRPLLIGGLLGAGGMAIGETIAIAVGFIW